MLQTLKVVGKAASIFQSTHAARIEFSDSKRKYWLRRAMSHCKDRSSSAVTRQMFCVDHAGNAFKTFSDLIDAGGFPFKHEENDLNAKIIIPRETLKHC